MSQMASSGQMKVLCLRLVRGQDLRQRLESLVTEHKIMSAFILSCAGSLSRATLRFATQPSGDHETRTIDQFMEIVSFSGTLSPQGCHLHICLSDDRGTVMGGHLMGGHPCVVQTTVEVVIGYLDDVVFGRSMDPDTGYKELVIRKK